jgi:hypothetical protein
MVDFAKLRRQSPFRRVEAFGGETAVAEDMLTAAEAKVEGTPEAKAQATTRSKLEGLTYAGIGSRETPALALSLMGKLAARLGQRGWTLRSGGAWGADNAFLLGASGAGDVELYLPWRGYNEHAVSVRLNTPSPAALGIAQAFHPAWPRLTQGAQKLHGRNVHIVLGPDVQAPAPVKMIICWTKDGNVIGGTGQALRMAAHYKIPVFNLGEPIGMKAVLQNLATFINQFSRGD